MSPPPHNPKPASQRQIGLLPTIAGTILVTAALTLLSVPFGGFGAYGSGNAAAGTPAGLSLPIILHLATILPALLLGPMVLWRRKGDATHRLLGRIWAGLMFTSAIASAFIRTPGAGIAGTGYSFIHIFTVWTLINVPLAVWMARQGRIAVHRGMMRGLYAGMVIAGAFTFIPGRLLGNLVFGAP
ncbi:MAG: DUF2306 domain-containing protein [Erythrobacter sp.]